MMHLEILQKKIFQNKENFSEKLHYYRFKNLKIVFTNGCFDLMHYGHIDYLSKAADLGQVLIVGLNSDDSVRKLKQHNRPITDLKSRSAVLASLSFVSDVIVFEEETPLELIKFIKPDFLVKGKDYEVSQIIGADVVQSYNGTIATIELSEGYSTSNIERKIREGK